MRSRGRSGSGRKGRARRGPRLGTARTPLTPEIARTWQITVINPILDGLRREQALLAQKNWTWRHSTGHFEHLWPVSIYVPAFYSDNFAAFCRTYASAARAMQAHDAHLHKLAALCNKTFRHLFESSELIAAVETANAAAVQKGINLDDARGAFPWEDWPKLLAEYLINNIGSVPEYYTTAAFWREAGEIVLTVRNSPELSSQFEALNRTGGELLRATEQAELALLSIRNEYLRKFGLPPVPFPFSVTGSAF